MKKRTWVVVIALLGISGMISLLLGAITIMLATVTAILASITVHTYFFVYRTEPDSQIKKRLSIGVVFPLSYTIFFGVFTLYMFSRWLSS